MPKDIKLEGTLNTRDLGGIKTKDGKTLKYGRLIRSDQLANLTENDVNLLTNIYKVKEIVDFRSLEEVKRHGPDKQLKNANYNRIDIVDSLITNKPYEHDSYGIKEDNILGIINYIYMLNKEGDAKSGMEKQYARFVGGEIGINGYKSFFNILLNNKKDAVIYHCADGKDRTGIATALFLDLFGVDREVIFDDYLKSFNNVKIKGERIVSYILNHYDVPNKKLLDNIVLIYGVSRNWLEAAFRVIDDKYGSTYNYFIEALKFTPEQIDELKNNYFE